MTPVVVVLQSLLLVAWYAVPEMAHIPSKVIFVPVFMLGIFYVWVFLLTLFGDS